WQFGRNQDSFITSADIVVAGAIHQGKKWDGDTFWQKIFVGARLYSEASSGASFQVTRSGVSFSPDRLDGSFNGWDASHDLVGGSENEHLLQLGLWERTADSNGHGSGQDRLLILTTGSLYQYWV